MTEAAAGLKAGPAADKSTMHTYIDEKGATGYDVVIGV
jgi:hypothetical protein